MFGFLSNFGALGDVFSGLGGFASDLGSLARQANRYLTPALQLGTAGLGIYGAVTGMQRAAEADRAARGAMRAQSQLAAEQRAAAAPALAVGGRLLRAGEAGLLHGALPPGLEAQVQDWRNKAQMQMRQYLADAGLENSQTARQWDAWLGQQEQILRAQLAGQLFDLGRAGLGTGLDVYGGAAGGYDDVMRAAGGYGRTVNDLLTSANQALGMLAGYDPRKHQQQAQSQ